jgi:hypothetical protein
MLVMMGFASNLDEDILTAFELERKDVLIANGLVECQKLLGKQKISDSYFFYEGSIDGFEECKGYSRFSHFEKRLEDLHWEEKRELSKSSISDVVLKEQLGIYDKNAKTDYAELWKLKGIKTQIGFIYERLKLYRGLKQMMDEIAEDTKTDRAVAHCS